MPLFGIGLYNLVAYTMARRTSEIGIRVALGTNPGSVVRPILCEALLLAGAGAAAGIRALAVAAALAAWMPARRTAKIDPLQAHVPA